MTLSCPLFLLSVVISYRMLQQHDIFAEVLVLIGTVLGGLSSIWVHVFGLLIPYTGLLQQTMTHA